ncbi:MAG: condensation domain-containing protein, partial [Stackebrandtia sp.]
AYMVPAAVVVLAALPLNTSGKLDRKALPEPEFEAREFRAPSTPVEEIVAGVFAEVLGVERIGADDDFVALGGNSLIATQVAARLGAALDARVPVRTLFEASTVSALAARISEHAGAGGRVALVPQPRPTRTLPTGEVVTAVPLSLAQQRMWFLNRFDPDSAAENIPVAVRLSGALDVAALQLAFADVLARHESLRTFYPEVDGKPFQQVAATAEVIPELTPLEVDATELPGRLADMVLTGFDVTASAPFRARLFEVSPTEYVLGFVTHHISGDGFSMAPLLRDVVTAYMARAAGEAPGWAPLAVQYADYAVWQRGWVEGEVLEEQARYWLERLGGAPALLELPTDHARPQRQNHAGGTLRVELDEELTRGLRVLSQRHGTT